MSDLSDCDHSFALFNTDQGYRMRCTKCQALYVVDSLGEAIVNQAESLTKATALLKRWLRAYAPERAWVNGERYYDCQTCEASSTKGRNSIVHCDGCLWWETLRALEDK